MVHLYGCVIYLIYHCLFYLLFIIINQFLPCHIDKSYLYIILYFC